MKKIILLCFTAIISMGVYAQIDSSNNQISNPNSKNNSNADLKNNSGMNSNLDMNGNTNRDLNTKTDLLRQPTMRDSSGIRDRQHSNNRDSAQTVREIQPQPPATPVKVTPVQKPRPVNNAKTTKDKMYLVPDSILKKDNNQK